mgnify:CR=1 FL=1
MQDNRVIRYQNILGFVGIHNQAFLTTTDDRCYRPACNCALASALRNRLTHRLLHRVANIT